MMWCCVPLVGLGVLESTVFVGFFFFSFFFLTNLVVPVYTSYILRGTLRFLNKILLLIKKKTEDPPLI